MSPRSLALGLALIGFAQLSHAGERLPIPDKLVVLTFDDSVKSHHEVARTLLKKYGFGATFFVTEGFAFPKDKTNYMTWAEIKALHDDGFEIGNHTRDHLGVSSSNVGKLEEQLAAIDARCKEYSIPKPTSFAYPGNAIVPEAIPVLKAHGITFARRGGAPEQPYDRGRGTAYEPGKDHPLLLPTAGDARPFWNLDDFKAAVAKAKDGKVAVLQFHGVPEGEHPWVHTPRERFEQYMAYLKDNGFQVIAVRDLAKYVDPKNEPSDPYAIIKARLAKQAAAEVKSKGWTITSTRPELEPNLWTDGTTFKLSNRRKPSIDGAWATTYDVAGGKTYRFSAKYKAKDVEVERLSVVAELRWKDSQGKSVKRDEPSVGGYMRGSLPTAETDYPASSVPDRDGWIEVADTYTAPSNASQLSVELHLRWTAHGEVTWKDVRLEEAEPLPSRKVRLATVHYVPKGGKSPMDNCRQFEPFIADAAKQKADLIVLGETLTHPNMNRAYHEVAEPIPGPSTDYFGDLAKKYHMHIVAGLLEKDGPLVYNVAVLIDPAGRIIGKYRKVCLPRGEVDAGITPGTDYPVFETSFGKVGMMVCYDGFFPEVARELSNRGAEVIAFPVAGCNPLLVRARACENHLYVVSSTYTDAGANWMISGIFDHNGDILAQAPRWGSVAVAEVDLNRKTHWVSLGDYRAQLPRHRPGLPSSQPPVP